MNEAAALLTFIVAVVIAFNLGRRLGHSWCGRVVAAATSTFIFFGVPYTDFFAVLQVPVNFLVTIFLVGTFFQSIRSLLLTDGSTAPKFF